MPKHFIRLNSLGNLKLLPKSLSTVLLLTLASVAMAQETEGTNTPATSLEPSSVTSPRPALWQIYGFAGHFSQPAYPGSSSTTKKNLLLPYFVYRGENFQIDRRGAKVNTIKEENFKLDLDLGLNFGSDANDVPDREGMEELGTVLEVGPSAKLTLYRFGKEANIHLGVPIRAAFNMSEGFRYEGVAFNPQLSYERRTPSGWSYEANIGPVWGDQKYQANYYQVDPEFATASRAAYQAKAGLVSWRANLGVTKAITPQLRIFSALRYETVKGAANENSPLVKEKSGVSFFIGLNYSFWESEARAK